jgi:DNA-binding response OmpR family regulator
MPSIHLLIPDPPLRGAIAEQLKLANLGVAGEGVDAAAALADDEILAMIVDENAVDKKFLKILRDAAAAEKKEPIFLLGKAPDDETALFTEIFAKPLRLGHLLARLQFYIQVAPRLRSAPVTFGRYRLEPQNRLIAIAGSSSVIRLTEKETALIAYIGQSEQPVGREELLAAIWGYDARIDTHTLETHIYQLRRKLDPEGNGQDWLIKEGDGYWLKR